ncbi:MAG TPA: hypothetical protein PK037_14135 [Saprospiraceae bacterium]|nr:hypothetical protein [Saprospiraceae bacterium]
MKRDKIILLLLGIFFSCHAEAKLKIYLIHGYGGTGLELFKIQKALKKNGFIYETFHYNSLTEEIDSVAKKLNERIKNDSFDTLSFITHSMGALVVRSLQSFVDADPLFPFIQRIVMIAPPNRGSPIADFFLGCELTSFLAGPNLQHLSTDSINGAVKFPLPQCEVGLILGAIEKDELLSIPLNGPNDGIVLNDSSKMAIETDIWIEEDSHLGLLFNKRVVENVICFLNFGKFQTAKK